MLLSLRKNTKKIPPNKAKHKKKSLKPACRRDMRDADFEGFFLFFFCLVSDPHIRMAFFGLVSFPGAKMATNVAVHF